MTGHNFEKSLAHRRVPEYNSALRSGGRKMMKKCTLMVFALVFLAGCSYLYTEALRGKMKRLGNNRYGYHLFVPATWKRSVNSEIRPTEVKILSKSADAGIIIEVREGGDVPDLKGHIASLKGHEESSGVAVVWKKYLPFDDVPGYVFSVRWEGKLPIAGRVYGKAGKEYQATVSVVDRYPSPIILVCYAPREKFDEYSSEYFWHARESLKVIPIELTVREVEE
jgi:hypothetical protein